MSSLDETMKNFQKLETAKAAFIEDLVWAQDVIERAKLVYPTAYEILLQKAAVSSWSRLGRVLSAQDRIDASDKDLTEAWGNFADSCIEAGMKSEAFIEMVYFGIEDQDES